MAVNKLINSLLKKRIQNAALSKTGKLAPTFASVPNFHIGIAKPPLQSIPHIPVVTPAVPPEPASEPTYAKASENFGTLRHVDLVRDHFFNAHTNITFLRNLITDGNPGTSLLERVEKFLIKHNEKGFDYIIDHLKDLGLEVKPRTDKSKLQERYFTTPLPKIGEETTVDTDAFIVGAKLQKTSTFKHNAHSALFATGTVMTKDIRMMDALRAALVHVRNMHQQRLEEKEALLEDLDERIEETYTTLVGQEARRRETLDDYSVAQRLLGEHWQEVEAKYAERKRVIDSNLGLYYVRVRETPLSRPLPDPLDLRPAKTSDIVPGCSATPEPLTEELHPFIETVLDIPAAEWALLSKQSHHLPGRFLMEQLVKRRKQLIEIKLRSPKIIPYKHPSLSSFLFSHKTMIQRIAAKPFHYTSLREMQKQGHKILTLEDMLTIPIPALHTPATQLHQQLHTAAGCLLGRLRHIKPFIRLAWADLADENHLPVANPERWPNLDKAEADDFNNLRTLIELIHWLFNQLDANASGESRTAMGNLVRACLLLAASDDPQQLLHGQLKTLPTRFGMGELLRLQLNREPSPGSILHLFDDKQHVVATVRVEDHDETGTLASIAAIINPHITLSLAMHVTGQRR